MREYNMSQYIFQVIGVQNCEPQWLVREKLRVLEEKNLMFPVSFGININISIKKIEKIESLINSDKIIL